jgi:hypothetical protein
MADRLTECAAGDGGERRAVPSGSLSLNWVVRSVVMPTAAAPAN